MKNLLTLFGLGMTKFSASTASLIAVVMYWLICYTCKNPLAVNLVFFNLVLTASIYLVNKHKAYATSDPKEVVVDEFLGMHITLILANTKNLFYLSVLFVLFRVIDILKPPPFSTLEQKIDNQYGVLIDDIAIGITIGLVALLIS